VRLLFFENDFIYALLILIKTLKWMKQCYWSAMLLCLQKVSGNVLNIVLCLFLFSSVHLNVQIYIIHYCLYIMLFLKNIHVSVFYNQFNKLF